MENSRDYIAGNGTSWWKCRCLGRDAAFPAQDQTLVFSCFDSNLLCTSYCSASLAFGADLIVGESMIYVMSDLHGCYDAYRQALDRISFAEDDMLYVLGDVIDRGKDGIRILQDMMMRVNVIPILGNHEFMAMTVLKRLMNEITVDNVEDYLTVEDMTNYFHWTSDGGDVTVSAFRKLDRDSQMAILEYLEDFSLFEEICVHGRNYVLVHGGLEPFDLEKPLEAYDLTELLFQAPDYEKVYYPDKYLVTGHQSTLSLGDETLRGKILKKNNHIAIDCGCVFGGSLAVLRLDDGKEWYIHRNGESLNEKE